MMPYGAKIASLRRNIGSALRIRFMVAGLFVFTALFAASAAPVSAAAYAAQEVSRMPATITISPGGTQTVFVQFKNVGITSWTNYAKDFVSVYTYDPKYRASLFADTTWTGPTQPVRMQESVVGPGNTGTFQFRLTAPQAPGTYTETFSLAVEGIVWVDGGEFTLKITVVAPQTATAPVVAPAPTPAAPSTSAFVLDPHAPKWRGELVSITPSRVEVAPGAKATVTVKFRNTGSGTWTARGSNFVSIYTYVPKYRTSVFRDSSWRGDTQPAAITESFVGPGAVATLTFTLSAPQWAREYGEQFALAAENLAWIQGGTFTVPITVRAGATPAASAPAAPAPGALENGATPPTSATSLIGSKPADGFKALKLLTSARDLKMTGGNTVNFRVAFKNEGKKPWTGGGDLAVALAADVGNAYSFRHSSWQDSVFAARLATDAVQPGQLAFFDVTLAAPADAGSYVPRFVLTAGGAPVEGGTVEIPIEVTRGSAPASIPSFGGAPAPSGPRGPNIRVGLFNTASTVVIAASGTYTLIEGRDHTAVRQLSGVTSIYFDPATLRYTVTNGSYSQVFEYHPHLRPDDSANTIFEIRSYSSIPTWDTSVNFNKFRGELEVHYSAAAGEVWVIEELPMEDYMRGLAETSNGSPMEYQKALVTAARTFAYFVQKTGGKHASRYFDVTTGAGDQVYKGYVSELVRPNVVRAVEETRGMVVTYDGDVAVTPYFSRSDGRTRSYSEVWGKHNPWLVSKPAPYDAGKTLWGHGVGMSASDAVGRAEAGAGWQEILKYYYTGIELQQRY